MANRPPAGIDGRLLAKYEMPKMAFHATKRTNIDSGQKSCQTVCHAFHRANLAAS